MHLCIRILVRSKTATSLSFHVYSCICPDYSRPQISVARTCTLVRLCVISLHVRVRGCRLVRCTPKVTNSTTCNVQPATDIRVRSREWRGVPRRLTSGVNKSGFRRALGCRKRLAAQLPTCSDALGTWLARAAIVGGAFMLRVPRSLHRQVRAYRPQPAGQGTLPNAELH